jgi:TolB-like protein
MVDVSNGQIVWGKTFDEDASNVFALQDAIAVEIARVLKVKFSSSSERLSKREAVSS